MKIICAKNHEPGAREMRAVYAQSVVKLIEAGEPVLVTDADLMRAIGVLPYKEKYPDNIFDCGIAESNMIGVACGLSAEGFIPFTHSFGTFATRRVMDQVFMSGAYAKMNVKMLGSDPGVCAALNGGTHMALEDVAMMRAIPEMTIVEPTDAVMVEDLIPKIAHTYGMFYIRMCRGKAETIYEEGSEFDIGRAALLREGGDVTIIAAGREVVEALQAAALLEKEGKDESANYEFSGGVFSGSCRGASGPDGADRHTGQVRRSRPGRRAQGALRSDGGGHRRRGPEGRLQKVKRECIGQCPV